MLRIQPLALAADGPDCYRVRCLSQDGEVEYKFNMRESDTDTESDTDPDDRFPRREDKFYFATHDDSAGLLLEHSIRNFDRARQSGLAIPLGKGTSENAKMYPKSLVPEGKNARGEHQYVVVFDCEGREIKYMYTVTGSVDTIWTIACEYGCWSAKRDNWAVTTDGDDLIKCIARFHEAIISKQKDKPRRS